MSQRVIGMDRTSARPRSRSWSVIRPLSAGAGMPPTPPGYAAMLAEARRWPDRMWAIEGCQGIGRHLANRLLADGEHVVDVPPKLSARTRVFATGPTWSTGSWLPTL